MMVVTKTMSIIVFIIVVVVVIIPVITFMHSIYNYVPETNRVYRLFNVATVLNLQFVLRIILFRP